MTFLRHMSRAGVIAALIIITAVSVYGGSTAVVLWTSATAMALAIIDMYFGYKTENRTRRDVNVRLNTMLTDLGSANQRIGGHKADPLETLALLETELAHASDEANREQQNSAVLVSALAVQDVGIMVADNEDNVVFVNDCLQKMFERHRSDLKSVTKEFDEGCLVGVPVLSLTGKLNLRSHNVQMIEIGEQSFKLRVNPLPSESDVGGTVIAWHNRTEESVFEKDMERLLGSALVGDLSNRIDESQQTGFSSKLAQSVNELVSVAENIIVDTVRVFGALARGELDETIDANYEGSFGRLKEDANATIGRLREVVANIRNSVETVSTAFYEINQGNINLSHRTEQQASSLEETASAMEQMTGTVEKNAENASHANEIAHTAREQAEEGGNVVGKAVVAMQDIDESSRRISDIIGVIDEIAFQTNLLALNAAVEAARAGEQGRGFAVVAGEVRNLAGRSAEAAKEIKALIEDSVRKVQRGSDLVNRSGTTLESIVDSVKKVNGVVAEISMASHEQASGIAQVNATIGQMDEMTQQNAALVEQVSAASELASEQAQSLRELVAFFGSGAEFHEVVADVTATPYQSLDRPTVTAQDTAMFAPAKAANADIEADWEEF